MTIAMLSAWLDGYYQSQLWRGALAACRVHGCRLLCLVGYCSPDRPAPLGPHGIGGLAARPGIDAAMLAAGPLSFWEGPKALDQILSWLVDKPVVCLGQPRDGLPSIVPDGRGTGDLVHHLVREHGCRRFAFLEGPATNLDSARRLVDFLSACAAEGIVPDPMLREVGNFSSEGGERAMEAILARGRGFEAVLCANDAMAMGAALTLTRHGLRIPEDVRLLGYDDSEESRTHQPPLTTVRSPTYQIGLRGVERCLEELEHKPGLASVEILSTSLVVRKSCGCLANTPVPKPTLGTSQLRTLPTVSRFAERMLTEDPGKTHRFLEDFFATLRDSQDGELEEWQDILFMAARLALRQASSRRRQVEDTVLRAHALLSEAREGRQSRHRRTMDNLVRRLHVTMNSLHSDLARSGCEARLAQALQGWCPETRLILFRDDFTPLLDQNLSTCRFEFRISLRDGESIFIPAEQDLLPPEQDIGEIWLGMPLEHGEFQFGVLLFRDWPHSEAFVEHLRMVVSSFIHGVWRSETEQRHRLELHTLSINDPLTMLYNRRGFLEVGESMVALARREGWRLGVLMADLDDLKEINDCFGHEDGDLAIVALAEALRDSMRTSDTVARLGGDEFAAVYPLGETQPATDLGARIRRALERRSADLAKPWMVRASLGIQVWDPADGRCLADVLSDADAALYRDKKRRKAYGL